MTHTVWDFFFMDRHNPARSGTIRLFSVPPNITVIFTQPYIKNSFRICFFEKIAKIAIFWIWLIIGWPSKNFLSNLANLVQALNFRDGGRCSRKNNFYKSSSFYPATLSNSNFSFGRESQSRGILKKNKKGAKFPEGGFFERNARNYFVCFEIIVVTTKICKFSWISP